MIIVPLFLIPEFIALADFHLSNNLHLLQLNNIANSYACYSQISLIIDKADLQRANNISIGQDSSGAIPYPLNIEFAFIVSQTRWFNDSGCLMCFFSCVLYALLVVVATYLFPQCLPDCLSYCLMYCPTEGASRVY